MSEPSERMQEHLKNFLAAIVCYECTPDGVALEDLVTCGEELKAAIAELEQRAAKAKAERDVFEGHAAAQVREIREWIERVNKWKRVAVAMYEWGASFVPESGETEEYRSLMITEAANRADRASEALGDEWTEAVK